MIKDDEHVKAPGNFEHMVDVENPITLPKNVLAYVFIYPTTEGALQTQGGVSVNLMPDQDQLTVLELLLGAARLLLETRRHHLEQLRQQRRAAN